MNGRSQAIPAVLLALLAASVLIPPPSLVAADPDITDAGGGFKNATWDFAPAADYNVTNVTVATGDASLAKKGGWTNYTNDAEFWDANESTNRVNVSSGVRLEGSTANLITDGTFDQDPGPDWTYTNGPTGNVSAARDPTAKGTIWHSTPRTQFDSMVDCCALPTPNWTALSAGGSSAISQVPGSMRDDITLVIGGWSGATRNDGGTWDWRPYNRLAVWIDGSAAAGVQVYIHLENLGGANPWDYSPPLALASGWQRYIFSYSAFPGNAATIDRLDLRFSGPAGSYTTYIDDIDQFNLSAFDEAAKLSQTFGKPNSTINSPNAVVLTFDVEATLSIDVLGYFNVSVAGILEWTETPVVSGTRTLYLDLSGNVALQASGPFPIEFALHLTRIGTEEASMAVWIDNVTLTATDYRSGSFTANPWTPGSAAIWTTATNLSDTPPATSVVVETRTGPTPIPDVTWSPWNATSGGTIGSPPNVWLQWRLLLNTANGSETPVVTRLNLTFERYAPAGTVTTASFLPTDLLGWRWFFASDTRPPSTSVDYNVSVGGGPWVPVVDGSDLSGLTANATVVRANLTTANTSVTPTVAWFQIRYEYLGPVSRIEVTPDDVTMSADGTQAYTATGFDAFDHIVTGITCLWTPGAGALNNRTGTTATYEPTIPGTWEIRCEVGSVAGTANVTVTTGPLARIVVLPDPGLVNVTKSISFFAAGEDADGNAVPLAATTWTTTIGQISSAQTTQATLQAPVTEGTGTITARDGAVTGSASVQVLGLNAPRINGTIPDDSRPEDSPTWSLDLTTFAQNQVDADDTLANLRWTMTGLDGTIVTVFGTGVFGRHTLFFTPVPDAAGTDEVRLRLEDRGGARDSQTVNFTLTPVNDPPFFHHVPVVFVRCAEAYTLDFRPYVTDIDLPPNPLGLTSEDPSHITTDGTNATYRYPCSINRTLYVRHQVSDGQTSAEALVTIHVTDNPPPQLVKPIPDLTLTEDVRREDVFTPDSLREFFDDPEGEAFFLSSNFTHLDVDVWDRGYVQVNVTGAPNFCGVDRITFRATDLRGAYQEYTIRATVLCVNDAPVLGWTEDVHVQYNATHSLDLTTYVSDVDNAPEDLTLSADDFPRTSVDGFTVSFLYLWAPSDYSVAVLLSLSDGLAIDSQAIAVRVSNNRPPELINAIDPLQFDEDETVVDAIDLSFHFQDAEDGDALTYVLTSNKVTATVSSGRVTLRPAADWFGREVLMIRATDSGGAFAIATVDLDVLPVNDAPRMGDIPAQDRVGGRPWVVDLRDYVSDVDDDLSALTFATDSSNVRAVGYLLLFDFPFMDRTLNVRVTASDGRLLSDASIVRVVVQGPDIWARIGWPWSGFAMLALAVAGYFGYTRWIERRFSFEDLFLVGREGRLIMHTTRTLRAGRDEDLLAGMLTAIVMFVRDSFKEENEELKRFEFGDRIVAVEKSDHVYGAAIFGGVVPDGVYLSLRYFLADMEDRYADRLQRWSGDVADLPGLKAMMEYFGRRGKYRIGDWKRIAG